jgi:hypothetical protein
MFVEVNDRVAVRIQFKNGHYYFWGVITAIIADAKRRFLVKAITTSAGEMLRNFSSMLGDGYEEAVLCCEADFIDVCKYNQINPVLRCNRGV